MAVPERLAWIKPWMVVVVLAAVAVAGATGVYFAAEAQHRRDRTDIVRWEARAIPAAENAAAIRASLRADLSAAATIAARAALQRDLALIVGPPLPEIVRPAAAAYRSAIAQTAAALDAVRSPEFAGRLRQAGIAFQEAATAEQDLVCRARLPACRTQ